MFTELRAIAQEMRERELRKGFKSATLSSWADRIEAALPASVPEDTRAAVETIQYALQAEDGFLFLRLWNQGDFDTCREEWPDAPAACYVGADPLLA